MNAPEPLVTGPIDRLRARLARLAGDPRVQLVPNGRAIVHELGNLIDQVGELERRVSALERALAALVPPAVEFE